jgi:16S rRNA pseudouridine516 synthase
VRLDRLLANLGYGSRSEVRALILAGRASVGSVVVTNVAAPIADVDSVTVDGARLDRPHGVWIAVNKPLNYTCSHDTRDAKGGKLAYELLPPRMMARNPRPEGIGRLDRDTTGLWIVTDDHQAVHRLTSPKHHVPKRYVVTLEAPLGPATTPLLTDGTLMLDGERTPCLPAQLEFTDDPCVVHLTVTEGRYHQVRRMFAGVGSHVAGLHRASFGSLDLASLGLGLGEWCDVDLASIVRNI